MLCPFPHLSLTLTSWSQFQRSLVSSKSNDLFSALLGRYHYRWCYSLTLVLPLVSIHPFSGFPSTLQINTLVYSVWIIFHCATSSTFLQLLEMPKVQGCAWCSLPTQFSVKTSFTYMASPYCERKVPIRKLNSGLTTGLQTFKSSGLWDLPTKRQQHLHSLHSKSHHLPLKKIFPLPLEFSLSIKRDIFLFYQLRRLTSSWISSPPLILPVH